MNINAIPAAEAKKLIANAFYLAWESGVQNGSGKNVEARVYGQKADEARRELFKALGIEK
jgi:hypothetical protein